METAGRPRMLAPDAVRLVLVRHAEVAANRELRYLGSRDDPLTEEGMEQARRLAAVLSVLPITAVYTSPRRRSVDTATPIALGHGLVVEIRAALRETSYGAWEGSTRAEIVAAGGETAALLHAWEHGPTIAPPGGESIAATGARVVAEVERLRQRHAREVIVLVSHVGPIKSVVRRALGLQPGAGQMFLDPATISVVDWGPSGALLRLFNSHAHLGWERARWIAG